MIHCSLALVVRPSQLIIERYPFADVTVYSLLLETVGLWWVLEVIKALNPFAIDLEFYLEFIMKISDRVPKVLIREARMAYL